ncbi:MAG: hypothetical protein JW797_18270 [Bradymonadales bacterium]|nr:hypothetical protein [Bradymonadales bacterium]
MSAPKQKVAKTAAGRKVAKAGKIDPITGKPMTAVKVVRANGPSGMHWVILEEFDGSETAVRKMVPIS